MVMKLSPILFCLGLHGLSLESLVLGDELQSFMAGSVELLSFNQRKLAVLQRSIV